MSESTIGEQDVAHNLPGVDYSDLIGEEYVFPTGTRAIITGVLNRALSSSDVLVRTENGQNLRLGGDVIRRYIIEQGRDLNAPIVFRALTHAQRAVVRAVAHEETAGEFSAEYCLRHGLGSNRSERELEALDWKRPDFGD